MEDNRTSMENKSELSVENNQMNESSMVMYPQENDQKFVIIGDSQAGKSSCISREYTYKIVLLGSARVGKTSYVSQIANGKFPEKYNPTLGTEVTPVNIYTNHGRIKFLIWDCAGDSRYSGLGDGYYLGAHGAIVMIDDVSQEPQEYINAFRKTNPDAPVVVCRNKIESPSTPIDPSHIHISVRNNVDLSKPLMSMATRLTGFSDLEMNETIPEMPSEKKTNDPKPDDFTFGELMEQLDNTISDLEEQIGVARCLYQSLLTKTNNQEN